MDMKSQVQSEASDQNDSIDGDNDREGEMQARLRKEREQLLIGRFWLKLKINTLPNKFKL